MDPDRVVDVGERMQDLGRRIGLGVLSVCFALVVLAVVGGLLYSLVS